MGNQLPKGADSTSGSSKSAATNAKQIVVVHHHKEGSSIHENRLKQLRPLSTPLIPLGQASLNEQYPVIESNVLYDFGIHFEHEMRQNAELVAREQTKLCDKVRDSDHCISIATHSIAIERQRKINKACENVGKFDEIDQLILRCEADIENILSGFIKLNDALPPAFALEPFAF